MRTLAKDTSPEVETQLINLWRQQTPAKKLKSLTGLGQLVKNLIFSGLRLQNPQASKRELYHQFYIRRLGREPADKIFAHGKSVSQNLEGDMTEPQIIALAIRQLDHLKIPYYISGGVASIIYGEPRLTNDADLVIRIFPFHIPKLVQAFENEFVISAGAIQTALQGRRAFNMIHVDTAFKIDFYPISDDDDLEIDAFARRRLNDIGAGEVWLASAEDVILAKLRWFRFGGEVSETQWRDVLGVLKVQGEKLDFAYLSAQAQRFGLKDLFDQAREDAG
ncbi:hypothetical protein FBQ85_21515 [Cytophagia bacterium CHB2]|nr:hypothetical protein [Cytophagia bacterium CHB2]